MVIAEAISAAAMILVLWIRGYGRTLFCFINCVMFCEWPLVVAVEHFHPYNGYVLWHILNTFNILLNLWMAYSCPFPKVDWLLYLQTFLMFAYYFPLNRFEEFHPTMTLYLLSRIFDLIIPTVVIFLCYSQPKGAFHAERSDPRPEPAQAG